MNSALVSYDELLSMLDRKRLPVHVAVIMDGNGRWAKQRHLPRIEGHRAGVKSVQEVVSSAREMGIGVLTLYAFSSENWKRPRTEVSALMLLLRQFMKSELKKMLDNDIRFNVIGRTHLLPDAVQKGIEQTRKATENCRGMTLNLALNYGARSEIEDAFASIVSKIQAGQLQPTQVDADLISQHLYTGDFPDPDLLIRTSGELRISNFLLWQIAYAELWFTDVLWPDFRREHLAQAVLDFQKRQRRFGDVVSKGGNEPTHE